MKRICTAISLLAALLLGVACDPVADADYPGEPLLTLSGTVESTLAASPQTDVAIVWATGNPELDEQPLPLAEVVPVTGEFPSAFQLNVYLPPPAEAQLELEEEPGVDVAMGFIVAIPGGTESNEVELDSILGVTDQVAVIWLGDEASVDFAKTTISGGHLQVGYNLLAIPPEDYEPTGPYVDCMEDHVDEAEACMNTCEPPPCEPGETCEYPAEDECFMACDEEMSAGFDQCTPMLDWFVSPSTSIELVLDPEAVQGSVVWSIFGLANGDTIDEGAGDAPDEAPTDGEQG